MWGDSAPGCDRITAQIFKNILLKPLVHLINHSLTQGMFLDYLQVAKVIPLFK